MPCLANWGLTSPGSWGEIHFGSEFDCIPRVLVHARIDVLTHPHSWILLPSSVFVWVVIVVSIHDTSTPLNTLTHPVSITSITLHTTFTGLSSFRLVPMSTFPSVEGYIFGSVPPLGQHIILPRGSHHNFWHPWVGPTDCKWPEPWKVFHLG